MANCWVRSTLGSERWPSFWHRFDRWLHLFGWFDRWLSAVAAVTIASMGVTPPCVCVCYSTSRFSRVYSCWRSKMIFSENASFRSQSVSCWYGIRLHDKSAIFYSAETHMRIWIWTTWFCSTSAWERRSLRVRLLGIGLFHLLSVHPPRKR